MVKTIRVALMAAIFVAGASMASADHVTCSRDINADGKVDLKDKQIIDDAMGSVEGKAPYDERADIDQDSKVTQSDRDAYRHCK